VVPAATAPSAPPGRATQHCHKPVSQIGKFSAVMSIDIFDSSIKSGANKGFLVVMHFAGG